MARKSNKTAHVLNLLAAGHEKEKEEETTDSAAAEAAPAEEPAAAAEPVKAEPAAPQNVSVIDTTGEDPLSELIQSKLMEEFGDTPELPNPAPESTLEPQPAPEPEPAPQPEPEPEPEPEPAPKEPEYVYVNVMERIVRDKIIYFMRQFGVCTCPRCIEDTIALTMNGILPKYQVLEASAVEPLLSFYTNRYIGDITVEATKACVEVRDHPRHKPEDLEA